MLWLFLIHNWLFWADKIEMDRWMVEVLSAPLWNQSCGIRWDRSSVQSLSHVQLFVTPWTAAHQASLSIINSQSLPKPMSIESVMPSNHLILCYPLLLPPSIVPSIRVFSSESVLHIRWPSIGVSASTSVLPMNIRDWFPLGWTSWILVGYFWL